MDKQWKTPIKVTHEFLKKHFFQQKQPQDKIRDLEEQILNSNQKNIDLLNEGNILINESNNKAVNNCSIIFLI